MYVCMYVCMYLCMYVCTKTNVYIFISDMNETRKVSFSGIRSEDEFIKLFRRAFPNHVFPNPFPRFYVKDNIYR